MTRGSWFKDIKCVFVVVVEHTFVSHIFSFFLSVPSFFLLTHMLPRSLFKYKAHISKANGCLYHCFRQKGRLFVNRGDI